MVSKRIESLDTNILLRVLFQDIPEQAELAMDLLEREDVIYKVSDAMLSELVFVLTRMKVDRESIVAALVRIVSRPNIKAGELMDIELFWE